MSRISLRSLVVFGVTLASCFAVQAVLAADSRGSKPAASGARSAGRLGFELGARAAEPLQVLKSGDEHTRLIYRAKALPAMELENTLKQLFQSEAELRSSADSDAPRAPSARVAVAPSAVSNVLIISGPPDAVAEVRSLLEGLDQPTGQIMLDVEIGEAPMGEETAEAGARSDGAQPADASTQQQRWTERPAKMETIGRVRLTTLDNQPAFAQMGARVPRVVGVSKSGDGEVRSTTLENVGLIVGVTPRITPDGAVVMEIDAEQSQLGPESEGIPIESRGDKVVRTPRIDTTTVQSTVTVSDGQTVVLASVARTRMGESDKALVIVVTPHIVVPDGVKKPR
ncbi:MAG: secretin N-terminal domain-containing protein [Planctomycetota bacterium]